jgi:uncharacterized PurR-regulated membrane protein YhhQ (DUF165 family)
MTDPKAYMPSNPIAIAAFCGYVACIYLANWLVVHVGLIHVGFGQQAPAGVLAAGLALTLRDQVQRHGGRPLVFIAIILGGALSALVSPVFALASAAAFLVSELVDMAVYTPLEARNRWAAISVSNTVGAAVDSWLFLVLSGLGLTFFWGQMLGKSWVTLATVLVLMGGQRALLARHA